ncbi:S-layer family protein [Acidocella sp.]|uniref:beta strand repeat-containing protein n=1 Tax=Acidocella sp. TaxID=50710 RepID=UPI00262E0E9E|nr:hypothetical protein [Acidocella sp.]
MVSTITSSETITGTLTSGTVGWGGTINVTGGGEVLSTSMQEDSQQAQDPIINVLSGGTATDTTVRAGDGLIVSSGGAASNSVVEYNGILSVSGSGSITQSTITAGGAELVSGNAVSDGSTITGGLGQGTTINVWPFAPGRELVISGGLAENSMIGNGGLAEIYSGGTEANSTISMSGTSLLFDGAVGKNLTVQNGGILLVKAGATLDGASVSSGGELLALPGSTINSITGSGNIITTGVVQLTSPEGFAPSIQYFGSSLSGTMISGDLSNYAFSGTIAEYALNLGTISDTTFSNNATVEAYNGGTLDSNLIESGATAITNGGFSTNLSISGGISQIEGGGKSSYSTISANGSESISSSGTSSNASILAGGTQDVLSGGTAVGSTIASGGIQFVQQSGTSTGANIQAGGIVVVGSGGTILDPTVQQGGVLINLGGGTVVGASALQTQNGILDIDQSSGSITQVTNQSDVTIESGHFAIASGTDSAIQTITVTNGGTLDINTGATVNSVVLDGGILEVSQDSNIQSVTIQVGTPGQYTNDSGKDISTLLNKELQSIPQGTSITVVFNPGEYGASGTVYLSSNTTVIGNGATLGALSGFKGSALFENYDQQNNNGTWVIHNTDGSTTVVDAGLGLENVATVTNNAYVDPTTTLQAQIPLLTTQYSVNDSSTPIVDTNISIDGMTFVEAKSISGTYSNSSVGRGIWLNDASNISINNNTFVGGVSGMSLVDDSNGVVAQNVIIGSSIPIDAWSGPSNLVIENNLLWEYSSSSPSGSTGAIQLNASANGYASNPGINGNGSTNNDGLIGNIISGSGPNTSGIAADPLYAYGQSSESNITAQGNIDNSLGDNTGGYYIANVQSANVTDNLYVGGSSEIVNTDSSPGTVATSITTAYGVVSGNLILADSSSLASAPILNFNIDPTTVDNAIFGNTTASSSEVGTWGFTGTSTTAGNIVSGSNGNSGSVVAPQIQIAASPIILGSLSSIQISGSISPQVYDASPSDNISVTLTSIFGTLSTNGTFGNERTTLTNGLESLVITGSESTVNSALDNLVYTTGAPNKADAIEINVTDAAGNRSTEYVPILANSVTEYPPLTIPTGFIEAPPSGLTLTGEMVVASGGDINMGATISGIFLNGGVNTVLAGTGNKYIAAGAGTTNINLTTGSDITVAGGVGNIYVDASSAGIGDKALVEAAQTTASVTGGAGAMTILGGSGTLHYQGGSGTTELISAPENGGTLTANMGTGNSTVFALSGDAHIQTNVNTDNVLTFGYGSNTLSSGGNDLVYAGAGSLYLLGNDGNTSIRGGTGSLTVQGGAGNISYQGGSGSTFLMSASTGGGNLIAELGTGNSTVDAASGYAFIQTESNTNNFIMAGSGNDTVLSNGNDVVSGGTGSLYIQTTDGNTSITGGIGSLTVRGGAGNITYHGGSGSTLLLSASTGGGNLIARLGTGNSTVDAASGNAFVQTQSSTNNVIAAGSGSDTVLSNGNDLILGGTGTLLVEAASSAQDTVISGSGQIIAENVGAASNLGIQVGAGGAKVNIGQNDAVTIGSSNNTVAAADSISVNQLTFSQHSSSNLLTLGSNDFLTSNLQSSGSSNALSVNGDANGGYVSTNYIDSVSISGSKNLFVLTGDSSSQGTAYITGADTLSVWSGNNNIIASGGAALFVSASDNTISGGNASLTLEGDGNVVDLGGQATVSDASPWNYGTSTNTNPVQNQFTVQGGQFNLGGKDTLLQTGASAAITLAGGNSAVLYGTGDSITACDQVYGGNSIVINGAGADSVKLVNVSDSAATISANTGAFVAATDDTGYKIGGVNTNSNERLVFIGGSGTSSTVLAAGSHTQVTLFGGASGHNIVSGGYAGNNSLNGGLGGGNLFFAGGNNDVLIGGGSGFNTLVSAAGNETLTGAGLGNDMFSITGGGGTDMIKDFSGSLVLASNLSVSKETVMGGSLNIYLNDGTHLIFLGLTNVNQNGHVFSHA